MAITFGMSTREFWEDDPEYLWAYRKSYMDKIKSQQETDNFNAWLNGLYVYNAVSISLHNGFGNGSAKSYMKQPIDFSKKTKEQIVEERENSIKEQLKRGKRALSKGVGK